VSLEELVFRSALEQAELVRSGQVSPVELVGGYLERIEELDPELNSFVTACSDEALVAARRAEEETGELPPFHGVPLPIKDLTETAGIRTTFSSKAFAEHVPPRDAAVVRRLREAGFIVIGKTNTPEFGSIAVTESELNGACRNPWNTDLTPGGSSGGAAAAVSAGLAPAAHGSDGGGSIRIPASCCGLFGIKPARGRVSNAPYSDGSVALGGSGPITRTVADAAALLDVMAGYEWGDPQWAPPPARPFLDEVDAEPGTLRIGFATTPPVDVPVDPVCVRAAEEAAVFLAELGHEVDEAAAPAWAADEFLPLFMRVWRLGPAMYPVQDPELLEPHNREFVEQAAATSSVEYGRTVLRLQVFARPVVAFFADYDLVLTPTLALPPVPVGSMFEDADGPVQACVRFTPFTPLVNLTGQPAVSLPLAETEDGVPVGVQLIGRPADEVTLLRVSAQVERARPWRDRRPPAPYGLQVPEEEPLAGTAEEAASERGVSSAKPDA
jgi:amidase